MFNIILYVNSQIKTLAQNFGELEKMAFLF